MAEKKKLGSWLIATILVLVLVAGIFLFDKYDRTKTSPPEFSNLPSDLIEDNDPLLGNTDATITILEFSDFECIYCKQAFDLTMPGLKNSSLFKEGKVNLVYKQFPLSQIHPYAQKAAEASLCAGDQNKFWEYHDLLFTNQDALTLEDLKKYSVTLKLDSLQFNKCIDDGKYESEVLKETSVAVSLGIGGTPAFIIVNKETEKGIAFEGAYPWSNFEKAINELQQ